MLRLHGHGLTVVGLSRAQVDLGDPSAVAAAVEAHAGSVDAVVNAAAYTAVDKAESEPDLADAANRAGPAAMAAACARASLPLIHLSTDYVFDGTKAGAYTEDDPVHPVSVYGAGKEAGERAVREVLARHIIVRTSWVFAGHGRNFVATMLRLGADRDELRVVADQTGCPTAAADIAAAVAAIARCVVDAEADNAAAPWGTYHFCGAPATTWHGLAEAVFAERQRLTGAAAPRVHPITTAEYPTPVQRPANSVLDCRRIAERFGVGQPDWRRSLAAAVEELVAARAGSPEGERR